MAAGNAFSLAHCLQRILLAAFHAVIAVNGAVQLQYIAAAGKLMQAVDILRDDSGQLSHLLQLRQFVMGCVGFGVKCGLHNFILIKFQKIIGMAEKKTVA